MDYSNRTFILHTSEASDPITGKEYGKHDELLYIIATKRKNDGTFYHIVSSPTGKIRWNAKTFEALLRTGKIEEVEA